VTALSTVMGLWRDGGVTPAVVMSRCILCRASARGVVPPVSLLEIVASLQIARHVWPDVHWKLFLSILGGSLLFVSLAQFIL